MRTRRTLVAILPLSLLLLTACVPTEQATPSASATPSSSASGSATPSATPTASSAPSTPVTIGCDSLISLQEMYDFNPNFSAKADYSPAAGSLGAEALEHKGIACAWVNQTSGELIEISVANPGDTVLTAKKNELVTTSNPVPTYEVEGYFIVDNGVGTAQAFDDPYWIVATSSLFFEPGDVAPLMAAAIANLG
ncbi:MAG TPA: hypothetical protein PKG61_11725 [Rhodoglobus sp.]|nr:hypothetical protein [Rhodoglobus sp.]